MTVVATIELPAEGFILGRAFADIDDYSIQLTQFVPIGEQLVPYFWVETTAIEAIEPVLRDNDCIADVTKYDERAGQTLCKIDWKQPLDELLTVFIETNVLVSEAYGTPDLWKFELVASDRNELVAFQSACHDRDIPVKFRRVFQSAPSSTERMEVTEKQLEILELAYERGYFEVPREVTVTELAEDLDISPQAASKRLRRGLVNALGFVLQTRRSAIGNR